MYDPAADLREREALIGRILDGATREERGAALLALMDHNSRMLVASIERAAQVAMAAGRRA